MKNIQALKLFKFNKLSFVILISIFFFNSCSQDEDTLWDLVELNSSNSSLVLMFSSSNIPPAGDYGLPVIDSMKNNLTDGVTGGNQLFYLSLYPQVSDPLYSPIAEKFKFKYDENGDNSLANFPAFVANTKNFNYELDSFKMNLKEQELRRPKISVGNLLKLNGSVLEMYVKVRYNDFYFDPHSVVVYIYEKTKIASQETISNGTVSNFVHKNVLLDFVNNENGDIFSEAIQYGHERELQYKYNIADNNVDNIGVLTVVYSLNAANQQNGVLAVYSN